MVSNHELENKLEPSTQFFSVSAPTEEGSAWEAALAWKITNISMEKTFQNYESHLQSGNGLGLGLHKSCTNNWGQEEIVEQLLALLQGGIHLSVLFQGGILPQPSEKWDVCHFCERGVKVRLQSVQFLRLVSSYPTLAINIVCYRQSIGVLQECVISTSQKYALCFSTIIWHIFDHVCKKVLSLLDVCPHYTTQFPKKIGLECVQCGNIYTMLFSNQALTALDFLLKSTIIETQLTPTNDLCLDFQKDFWKLRQKN